MEQVMKDSTTYSIMIRIAAAGLPTIAKNYMGTLDDLIAKFAPLLSIGNTADFSVTTSPRTINSLIKSIDRAHNIFYRGTSKRAYAHYEIVNA